MNQFCSLIHLILVLKSRHNQFEWLLPVNQPKKNLNKPCDLNLYPLLHKFIGLLWSSVLQTCLCNAPLLRRRGSLCVSLCVTHPNSQWKASQMISRLGPWLILQILNVASIPESSLWLLALPLYYGKAPRQLRSSCQLDFFFFGIYALRWCCCKVLAPSS